jgi:eukaryotic-like serine/threonine-protein kinase
MPATRNGISRRAGRTTCPHRERMQRAREARVAAAREQAELEHREKLYASARRSFQDISRELLTVVKREASTARFLHDPPPRGGGWSAELVGVRLSFSGPDAVTGEAWGDSQRPAIDVIAYGSVEAHRRPDLSWGRHSGYAGRSHALYFCDAATTGNYAWFETAFMGSPLLPRRASTEPFALLSAGPAARALCAGMADYQVAWPFTMLVIGDLGEFVDRWVGWVPMPLRADLHGRRACRSDRWTGPGAEVSPRAAGHIPCEIATIP